MMSQGLTPQTTRSDPAAGPNVTLARLDNGLTLVVIPDRRAPVVTHMLWYRNGAGDDPLAKSGIAHFLEHLMFKGTHSHPAGQFSQIVASVGGSENAFTSWDYTAYFQRVAPEHLKTMMALEADRMTGLLLDESTVATERDVVIEERRMRTENDPAEQLSEAMFSALFTHHPYGTPVIGWMHEIETLTREDALGYYQRFYTPNNAILILAGDITHDEALRVSDATYGRISPTGISPLRKRVKEPTPLVARRMTLSDAKVEQPAIERFYLAPSLRTGERRLIRGLEVLGQIMGGGQTSRFYRSLVMNDGPAASASAFYYSGLLDDTIFGLHLLPRAGVSLSQAEEAIDAEIAALLTDSVTGEELLRAQTRLIAMTIYAQDSQQSLAHQYGASLCNGSTIEDVKRWPTEIEAVTAADVLEAAHFVLNAKRSVTGLLLQDPSA